MKIGIKDEIHKIDGYSIFADESMNMRKVRIKDTTKEELKFKFFVIGGIEVPTMCNLNKLKDEFINDNFPNDELKYSYISYGKKDFKKVLKSKRLRILFKFILDNNIYIHVSILNYWYWAICDIVDSLIFKDKIDFNNNLNLKMAMYEALMAEYDDTYNTFLEFDFPSIQHGKEKEFIFRINKILQKTVNKRFKDGDEEYESIIRLIELIKEKHSNIDQLVFIQDEVPGEIVESLVNVYIQKAYFFINNGIVFDEELKIQKDMDSISPNLRQELNCSFINSKDNFALQISDVIVGFVARFFEFVSNQKEVEYFFDGLKTDGVEFDNIVLFKKIFDLSIEKYKFNYSRIISVHQDCSAYRFMSIIEYFNNIYNNKL